MACWLRRLYGVFACRRFTLRTLLLWCMAFGTAANLGYLFYSSVGNARLIESFNGFGYTLAEVAMMDLAVRATPSGSEGLGFSLMMSVRNFTLFGSDWFGSKASGNVASAFQYAGPRQWRDLIHRRSASTSASGDDRESERCGSPRRLRCSSCARRRPSPFDQPHANDDATTADIELRHWKSAGHTS